MNNFAHLKKESPFHALFPNGAVPIRNILVPSQARLEGSNETRVYMADLDKFTVDQFDRVVAVLSQLSGTPRGVIAREIKRDGLPIRANQTNGASTDVPVFL